MAVYLGIDTSNYTTSAALYSGDKKIAWGTKKLLPVRDGTLGLRQSDAVFAHVKQLGQLVEQLLKENTEPIAAIGVSTRPRDAEDSYMPCFLVGELVAKSLGAALHVPVHSFSHQAGHVMAALYSAGKLELVNHPFLAFHFSGGTTDCLLVQPDKEQVFGITELSTSADLKAGQAVDRVGVMLGLPFPAGPQLDELAKRSTKTFKHRPAFQGLNPCLSGIENKCRAMLEAGEPPEDIAKSCLDYLCAVADRMTADALQAHRNLSVIYAGGVMCNSFLRELLAEKYGGGFAAPEFSADNACGAALLCARREGIL